jgi:hypothetical protein
MAPIYEVSHLLFSEVTFGEKVEDEEGAKSRKETAGITTGGSGLPQGTYGEGEGNPETTQRNYISDFRHPAAKRSFAYKKTYAFIT